MKDQIDILNEEREQRLLREIRRELRYARTYRVLIGLFGMLLALLVGFGFAADAVDAEETNWILLGFAVVAFAAARIPQRDRLLHRAAEKLARQQD